MVPLFLERYTSTMALNIKDPVTEQLAAEIADLTGETKTRAVRVALEERKERLTVPPAHQSRAERLARFLETEAWPQIPAGLRGTALSKAEREEILGYGSAGA